MQGPLSNTNAMMNALKMLFQRFCFYDEEDVIEPDESTGWN